MAPLEAPLVLAREVPEGGGIGRTGGGGAGEVARQAGRLALGPEQQHLAAGRGEEDVAVELLLAWPEGARRGAGPELVREGARVGAGLGGLVDLDVVVLVAVERVEWLVAAAERLQSPVDVDEGPLLEALEELLRGLGQLGLELAPGELRGAGHQLVAGPASVGPGEHHERARTGARREAQQLAGGHLFGVGGSRGQLAAAAAGRGGGVLAGGARTGGEAALEAREPFGVEEDKQTDEGEDAQRVRVADEAHEERLAGQVELLEPADGWLRLMGPLGLAGPEEARVDL